MIMPAALNIKKDDFLLSFTHFIAIIQLVIQFCNAIMKLCCDPCHPQVSIFGI